jgi:maltose/moltooligosaccharide transporter
METQKPALSFWQIWNMSFGFLGIQFGWGLQLGNMSAIYERLGARPADIPALWLAAPMTGLLIQPLIGWMSDRTWGRLGRRRPYFLTGAILASSALFLMPRSSTIWMAAGLLWVLDASINVSMEPFRAFVADKLGEPQRNKGFVMQSFFIGAGAVLAGVLPFAFRRLNIVGESANGIPDTVRYSFEIGAGAFLSAVLWTVLSSAEYPPADPASFKATGAGGSPPPDKQVKTGKRTGGRRPWSDIGEAILQMPVTMRQLAVVQFFTWLGLYCMFLFFVPAVARGVFGASDSKSPLYVQGQEWGNVCFAIYNGVCFIAAFALPRVAAKVNRKKTHAAALICGGLGLVSVYMMKSPWQLAISMTGVGIAWASILSMPYAILSSALPAEKVGIYMGIFNFFIVIPEILASLTFGWIIEHVFSNNPIYVVMLGGVLLLVAAGLMPVVLDETGALPGKRTLLPAPSDRLETVWSKAADRA